MAGAAELGGAVDQGTQSTRFTLYGLDGAVVAKHQLEHPQVLPRAGWVEHDPAAIMANVWECAERATAAARERLGEVRVRAVGVTNQRETVVAWDRATGRPLHNAVVWMDLRTSEISAKLSERLGSKDALRGATGLPFSTYFSGLKIRWLLDHVPEVQRAAAEGRCCFGTIDSWVIFNLTGGASGGGRFCTDVSNAARYLLMNLETRRWDPECLQAFGIDPGTLPEIVSCAEVYGTVCRGCLEGVPVSGSVGDQQAATLGQRCREGEAKNTYGTGLFLLMNTGTSIVPSTHGLLTTVAFQLGKDAPTQYALEGSVATGGLAVSWLRDQLGLIGGPEDVEPVASSVPDTAGVCFVPAFSGLLAPHWREDARGAILGLTQYSSRAHIVRATLEALAFQSKDVLEAMAKDAGRPIKALRVDGGASRNNLLMSLQADLAGVTVERPSDIETTSRGAALAAGVGAGVWTAEEVFSPGFGSSGDVKTFAPGIAGAEREQRANRWAAAVQRSFGWAQTDAPDV